MFIELKLKNFRQHTDLTVNFENGVIALRGANEKGKTTLLEAIGYAMGGATQLREPLPEVVTWGQKESSLKVWLTFAINGVRYSVTRGKSGAEIRTDEQIQATGQSEVTRYIEGLLGCTIKTATKLMLANQQKLRGTLEEDGAAVKLIEELADFQLIDRIIALVQKNRPCGTTVPVESRISTLEGQLADPIVDDTGPMLLAHGQAVQVWNAAGEQYHASKAVYDQLQQPARDAQERLNREVTTTQAVEAAERRLASAKATFDAIQPVPGPAEEKLVELREKVSQAARWQDSVLAHQALQGIPDPMWEGTFEALEEDRQAIGKASAKISIARGELKTQIAVLSGQRITQSACGLCGKDLANVPEVVTKNADLDTRIADLELRLAALDLSQQAKDGEYSTYNDVVNAHNKAQRIFQRYAGYVELDTNFVPHKWTWKGPDMSKPPEDLSQQLREAESKSHQYQRDLGRQQQAQTALDAAEATLAEALAAADTASAAVGDAEDVLQKAAIATSELCDAEMQYKAAEQAVKDAERELQTACRMLEMRLQARKALETQLAAARREMADMEFNNVLVDTLRKIRPAIVEDLWNIVGASVSNTFSTIRGVPSVFARSDDSFTVDGKGIKGLSGSTLDALGLSIRMVLTTTFLPNTRFLVLDEPAAAADEGRETNMLGVIAASTFDQVILVTHSDLADSFATQVVQL